MLIANSNLVPRWADWDHFNELDKVGLMMYGQMTAGSWIYIGSQGIVQGTYETFVEVGRRHYGGDLAGRWILTGGLGGMGGAQPLAATMAGASMLAVECQPSRIDMRLQTGYLDRKADTIEEALAIIEQAKAQRQAGLGRTARQRRRDLPGTGPARHPARCGDRPDLRPRSAQRLPAGGLDAVGVGVEARARPEGGGDGGQAVDGGPGPGDARLPRAGHPGARLRQQHPPDGEGDGRRQRLRLPRLRPGLYPAAVLPGHRPVPLGGACRAIRRTSTGPTPR